MFELAAAVVLAAVSGAIVALKVIAPKTKTTADDKVLAFAEKYEVPLEELLALLTKK